MSFLRVDKERLQRKGSIFVAEVGEGKVVIGRVQSSCRIAAILAVAADWIVKDKLPAIKILKFKRVRDTYRSEALLNSYLMDHIDPSGDFYSVDNKILSEYWKEV